LIFKTVATIKSETISNFKCSNAQNVMLFGLTIPKLVPTKVVAALKDSARRIGLKSLERNLDCKDKNVY
jgi:hypothetical protein